jgi:hypothetical protein
MPSQFWVSNPNSPAEGAGAALVSSVTLTDISPASPQYFTNAPLYAGQRFRLSAYGIFSTTGTPTLLMGFYYGGVAGTLLAATAATATGSGAAAWPWEAHLNFRVVTIGTSGTVWCKGWVDTPTGLAALTRTPIPITQTQPITVDTTTSKALTFGAQWGTSSASNTITCEDFIVESLN